MLHYARLIPTATLLLGLALVSTSAAGVRGGRLSLLTNCEQLVDLEILPSPPKCQSHGFLYHGGLCPEDSTDCQDFPVLVQQPDHEQEVYIVVSDVEDSKVVYYSGRQKEGGIFQISASASQSLPEAYKVTMYALSDTSSSNEEPHRWPLQTMLVAAPCGSVPLEALSVTSPIQLIFTAKATLEVQPEDVRVISLATNNGGESWALESIESQEGPEDLVQVTAQVQSTLGRHCTLHKQLQRQQQPQQVQ